MNATAPPDSTSFIFVNGIRTTVDGWAETGVDAKLLINDPRFPRSSATMYWNANLHGTIMMFVNNTVRCDGRGARDSKFRKVLTTLKRWAVCKTLGLVTTFLVDDLLFSATEFVQQQWNVGLPDGPEDPDSDHLAVLASSFHHANQNTIVVAHSQGNMVFNDALPHIASYDSGLQFSVCTGLVSLASPITRGTFRMDTTLLRGLTINGDLLLQLQLPNDFPPLPDHHRNETTAQRDSALASMHPAFRGFANFFKWGFAIHDVAPNYFRGMLADTVLTRFSEVYSACPH